MLLVVATMCLVDAEKVCKQVEFIRSGETLTPYCAMMPQPQLVKWMEQNPGWVPRKVTCTDPMKDL